MPGSRRSRRRSVIQSGEGRAGPACDILAPMKASLEEALGRLTEIDRELHLISGVNALLGWDQETYMPSGGLDVRGRQLSLMEGLGHDRLVSGETARVLGALGVDDSNPMGDGELSPDQRRYLRAFHRAWSRAKKLPGDFVRERAREISLSQAAWAKARAENDFASFEPHLSKMVSFARREAAYVGYERDPYTGLLDAYEPGTTEASLEKAFGGLKAGLVSLMGKIARSPAIDDGCLRRHCPSEVQARFSSRVLGYLGFDPEGGRLDSSAHPFTTTIGRGDVRITTRYLEDYFASSISSTIHEAGHALYEQGLPAEWAGTMAGDAASMAVHESQSRFWENMVGKGLPFWKARFKDLQEDIGGPLDGVSAEEFHRALNKVEPGLIRVDADEVSYSLHVILRFEIESALVSGALESAGVPEAWNALMKKHLGIVPPDDAKGCLQDIHWSIGAIGYFPSYALGNLYAAQFADRMDADIGGIDGAAGSDDLSSILDWLRKNVHRKGALRTPSELIEETTGSALDPAFFLSYLERKYAGIYGFALG